MKFLRTKSSIEDRMTLLEAELDELKQLATFEDREVQDYRYSTDSLNNAPHVQTISLSAPKAMMRTLLRYLKDRIKALEESHFKIAGEQIPALQETVDHLKKGDQFVVGSPDKWVPKHKK